jgi:hypothetical protein
MTSSTVLPFPHAPNRWGEYLADLARAHEPPKPAVIAHEGARRPVFNRSAQPANAEDRQSWA